MEPQIQCVHQYGISVPIKYGISGNDVIPTGCAIGDPVPLQLSGDGALIPGIHKNDFLLLRILVETVD
jgi:hypothetical protein